MSPEGPQWLDGASAEIVTLSASAAINKNGALPGEAAPLLWVVPGTRSRPYAPHQQVERTAAPIGAADVQIARTNGESSTHDPSGHRIHEDRSALPRLRGSVEIYLPQRRHFHLESVIDHLPVISEPL